MANLNHRLQLCHSIMHWCAAMQQLPRNHYNRSAAISNTTTATSTSPAINLLRLPTLLLSVHYLYFRVYCQKTEVLLLTSSTTANISSTTYLAESLQQHCTQ
jgi:hypothetical protein